MKIKILSLFIMLVFLGCTGESPKPNTAISTVQERIVLLDFELEQNVSSLPTNTISAKFSGDELLARRFEVFKMQGKKYATDKAFWAFEAYKPSAKKKYYFSNFREVPQAWFDAQRANANFAALNSLALAAVTTANTSLRNFPTDEPIFHNPQTPGEGYPFDYLQASTISIGYPLFVSHFSADRAWVLVSDDTTWGWIKVDDVRFLTAAQAQAYREQKFLAIKVDKTPVYDGGGNFIFYARVGAVLGYLSEDTGAFYGQIYTRAGLKSYQISKTAAAPYPLKFDDASVREVASSLLNQPYGWGGTGDMRDCSLFTKDFLGSFGLWLPRNSRAQASAGEHIDLRGLSAQEKLSLIKTRGVPYMTLVHLPGHIMLYVGARGDDLLVMHDAWGLKTTGGGRALIGGTAITTLKIGQGRDDINEKDLLISKVDSINILRTPIITEANLTSQSELNLTDFTLFSDSLRNLTHLVQAQNIASDAQLDISRTTPMQPNFDQIKKASEQVQKIDAKSDENLTIKRFEQAYGVQVEENLVKFKDGSVIKFDEGVPNDDECLAHEADPQDMIAFSYAAFAPLDAPLSDAGRCRNYELLGKIYGASESAVRANLTEVVWLPKSLNLKLKFNSQNGAANALKAVSAELDELVVREPRMSEFLKNPGGTFKWRVIAGTNRLSAHSYGICIDINVAKSHYWRWSKNGYENLIPREIVEIFERHKFVWGGRWRHFDTMHFEYRPELFE